MSASELADLIMHVHSSDTCKRLLLRYCGYTPTAEVGIHQLCTEAIARYGNEISAK